MPLTTLIAMCFLPASLAVTEFSTDPVTLSVPAATWSSSAHGMTKCTLKCSAVMSTNCFAFVFLSQSKLCLMSAEKYANFSAVAPHSQVYRRLPAYEPVRQSYVTIWSRQFRIIQHRSKGELSFARSWTDYENGFGDDTDFWIGLKTMHELTGNTPRPLRVEAVTWSDVLSVSEYSGFTVGDASTNYTMTFDSYLSGSSNTTHDSFGDHKGRQFSAIDRDNDLLSGQSCSNNCGFGGWWYNTCFGTNPNGIYRTSAELGTTFMVWRDASGGQDIALKSIRMMIQLA